MKNYDFQIIANLMAGKGEARKKLVDVEEFLEAHGKTFRSLKIEKPTPISQIPQDGRTFIEKGLICIGGDGTVSETVGYVLNNKINIPLAVIPTGTANIIATTLGINKSADFDFLLAGKTGQLDIGVAEYANNEKHFFLLGLGLGFEEKFLKLAKDKLKSKFGVFTYFLAALTELLSLKKISLSISDNQKAINTDVSLLTVLNLQPRIFKHFPLFKWPEIKGDDGRLNLYFVQYRNYFQALLGTLAFHLLGRKNFGLVKTLSSPSFVLDSKSLVGTQLDGESHGNLPVKIFLYPKQISFLIS